MAEQERPKDLDERFEKFDMLELPGQPQGMHMGTSYLVGDARRWIKVLEGRIAEAERRITERDDAEEIDELILADLLRILLGEIPNEETDV